MHYALEVIIPPTSFHKIPEYMQRIFAKLVKEDSDGNLKDYGSWWDYWVLGGRYSGRKIQAKYSTERMDAFMNALREARVTIAGLQMGKDELHPAEQIPMVDAMWREHFPEETGPCPLFKHSGEQFTPSDVCKVSEIPENLTAYRVIVAHDFIRPHDGVRDTAIRRMVVTEIWNEVEMQKTHFDGRVKAFVGGVMARQSLSEEHGYYKRVHDVTGDWLCVTVDYHN